MRTVTLCTLAGALILASSALAAPANGSNDVVMQVQTVTAKQYHPTPQEIMDVRGTYKMDNGQTMKVWSESRRMYAEVIGQARTEIFPVAENVFVNSTEEVKLTFTPIPFATDVKMTTTRR